MLPLYLTFAVIVGLIILFYEVGFRIGKNSLLKKKLVESSTLGQIAGGLLGMLAFVLAITFSIVNSHYSMRQKMVLEEANAIGTAHLRAGLLPAEQGAELKSLLEEYTDTRLELIDKKTRPQAMQRSVEIHGLLWDQARAAALEETNTNSSLVLQAINEVIDMHSRREAAGLNYSVPYSVWIVLFLISSISMFTLGYQAGFNQSRKWLAIIPLVLAFGALTVLIVDLNNPQEGFIRIGQEPIVNLNESFN